MRTTIIQKGCDILEKVFISGSANCTGLNKNIESVLDIMMSKNYTILVGDCKGVDSMVQSYLNSKNYSHVLVYCSGPTCRNLINPSWTVNHIQVQPDIKGRAFYEQKDIAMSNDADYGFAIWDGVSVGTRRNIDRMIASKKYVKIFRSDLNIFETYNAASVSEKGMKKNEPSDQISM